MAENMVEERVPEAVLPAETAPVHRLQGATVVDPSDRRMGVVSLVVRRWDGARLVFVQRGLPARMRVVLDLAGGYLDADGVLHVSSRRNVELVAD